MHGLYILYWVREQHVAAAVVALALVAGEVALTLLEVPTGWLADRFGHRASLIAGSLLQVAGMLLWWLGPGVPGLFAASICVALGDAFRSGADQALLYRSCAALGCADAAFQRIESRAHAIQLAALVGFILLGGVIVNAFGFAAGWAVEVACSAVGLGVALAMTEPAAVNAGGDEDEDQEAGGRERAPSGDCGAGSWPLATGARRLAAWTALIAPASLLGAVVAAGSFFTQSSEDLAPTRMTIAIAAFTLAEALGAMAARFVEASARMQIALAIGGAVALAAAAVMPAVTLPAIVALAFLQGAAQPLRATTIQRMASDAARARTASIASAADKIVAAAALVVVGRMRR